MNDWLTARRPLRLNGLTIPRDLQVLVLAPHPDDFDAVGVTLRRFHDNSNRIEVVVVTSGSGGVEDGFCADAPHPGVKARLRAAEQQASCRFFGLPKERLTLWQLPEDDEGHLRDPLATAAAIRRLFDVVRPNLVFLPSGNDSNRDHRDVYAAARTAAMSGNRLVTLFLNEDPKTLAIRPDTYMAFDETAAVWKAELLRHHHSQQQRNLNQRGHGFDERILQVNRKAAARLALPEPYAEIFEIEIPTGVSA